MKLTHHLSLLIENGFSELFDCSIRASYSKLGDAYAEFERYGRFSYDISVSRSLRKASDEVIRGWSNRQRT